MSFDHLVGQAKQWERNLNPSVSAAWRLMAIAGIVGGCARAIRGQAAASPSCDVAVAWNSPIPVGSSGCRIAECFKFAFEKTARWEADERPVRVLVV